MSRDPLTYTWWLVARATGITALIAVSVAVGTGLFVATRGEPRKPGAARVGFDLHRQLAVIALVATMGHVAALVADPWLHAGLIDVLVPGTIAYRPVWVAAGIVAAYLSFTLGASYRLRARIGKRRWRTLHRLNMAAYALIVVHVLGAGSDAGTLWLRGILLATFLPALFNLVLRLSNPKPAPRPARRSPVTAALTER